MYSFLHAYTVPFRQVNITIHSGPFSHPFNVTLGGFIVTNTPPDVCVLTERGVA